MKYPGIFRGVKAKKVFKNYDEFEEFSRNFYKKIKPQLDKFKKIERDMAEWRNEVDARGLGPRIERCGGSRPLSATKLLC